MEEVPVHVHPGSIVSDVLTKQHKHRSGMIWSGNRETSITNLQCRCFGRNLFQPIVELLSGAFLDMGMGEQIDDLTESDTIRLLDWNDAMTDIQLGMTFVDKVQAISAVQKWSIRIGREYRVVKSKSD
ncbi:hypothetical protein M9H77_18827 [Catharanthus roseus]|uniref:Uncharacterized protein n=1 Tax=Catharanthus roseus TaxID=4058 RepID=A0ACC0B8H7_CATRO|nr:hypothetical protein M9H77_18827 [Catharanthus roseus]